jgi:hypothetical protein
MTKRLYPTPFAFLLDSLYWSSPTADPNPRPSPAIDHTYIRGLFSFSTRISCVFGDAVSTSTSSPEAPTHTGSQAVG